MKSHAVLVCVLLFVLSCGKSEKKKEDSTTKKPDVATPKTPKNKVSQNGNVKVEPLVLFRGLLKGDAKLLSMAQSLKRDQKSTIWDKGMTPLHAAAKGVICRSYRRFLFLIL